MERFDKAICSTTAVLTSAPRPRLQSPAFLKSQRAPLARRRAFPSAALGGCSWLSQWPTVAPAAVHACSAGTVCTSSLHGTTYQQPHTHLIHNSQWGQWGLWEPHLLRGTPTHHLRGTPIKDTHSTAGRVDLRSLLRPQCMWWKTKEETTWAHPPASQPAGLLCVAAASGTCSPDHLMSPALPLGRSVPPPISVPGPISSDCYKVASSAQTPLLSVLWSFRLVRVTAI